MLLAKMIVSFLISNWIYSEICYFIPSVDTLVKRVYNQVQIPTHDKWEPILTSSGGKKLGHKIKKDVNASGLSRTWPFSIISDESLKHVWNSGGMRSLTSLFDGKPAHESDSGLLSGDDMFRVEPWHPSLAAHSVPLAGDAGFLEVDSVELLAQGSDNDMVSWH